MDHFRHQDYVVRVGIGCRNAVPDSCLVPVRLCRFDVTVTDFKRAPNTVEALFVVGIPIRPEAGISLVAIVRPSREPAERFPTGQAEAVSGSAAFTVLSDPVEPSRRSSSSMWAGLMNRRPRAILANSHFYDACRLTPHGRRRSVTHLSFFTRITRTTTPCGMDYLRYERDATNTHLSISCEPCTVAD